MKALLKKYDKEKMFEQELVELPDDYDGDPYGDKVPFVVASNWQLVPIDDDEDASQYRYPKQLHTFPKDQFKNPDGPLTAWVYNGIADPVEPYANYIIEVLADGQFMLVLENDSFISDDLASLEARLFEWMEGEGVEPKKPERFELVLQPEPHVWDTKRKQVVFTINAPYAQMICLERPDTGFTALVDWMNSLDEEALASEGIE